MTVAETEAALAARGCTVVEDKGDFALVHPSDSYQGRMRAHDLAAKTHGAAVAEAWDWVRDNL